MGRSADQFHEAGRSCRGEARLEKIDGLREKGLVKNERALVETLVTRNDVQRQESRAFLDKKFHGSLPAFVAAFLGDERLTREEADKLQALIDKAKEEEA